ncbi:MAG: sigma-54 dependent transcriptional regulator [Bacteroidales bacterium]|jgi:DNA-binding NtrC family response regulator
MKKGKVLIVDDNKSALSALRLLLQFEFELVKTLGSPNQIASELGKTEYDVVLLDMNFSAGLNTGNEGLYWLSEIKKMAPQTEVVMITAYGDVELAVRALKKGAADFILKPWENEKLVATLLSAYKLRQSNMQVDVLQKRENSLKKEMNSANRMIIGTSPAIMQVLKVIQKVARTDANVLITGENGTGKELVAREIHRKSHRNNEIMVTVDMGAIPETLFESELFGHKKGAFTDAHEDRVGKIQLADKGTLFFDEIGNLSLSMQSKLLVAIESRKIVPVGGNHPVPVDIRLISATNCNLEKMAAQQDFREDLFYRLNTIRIDVPPLRERDDDIELLADFFLKCFENKYHKPALQINRQAIRKLKKYPWPGNIREFQHTIEKAVILADSSTLKPEDFVFRSPGRKIHGVPQTLEEMERDLIEDALERQNGNLTAAADQLGISRQTLYNKIKRYDV